jgi:diguanylate cyclase (GGDEF)-like protein/PAS domain S-box-containing protein
VKALRTSANEGAGFALSLLQAVPAPLLVLDEAGLVEMVNPSAERLFGHAREALVGRPADALSPEDERGTHPLNARSLGAPRRGPPSEITHVVTADGERVAVEVQVALAQTTLGVLYVALLHDLRPRLEIEAKLRYASTHDPLTGLFNRGFLDERRASIEADPQPSAVMIADVDGLKAVNDRGGHDAGDRLLRRSAAALSVAASGPGDFVVRLGGDEFAVILADADAARIERAVKAVRVAVAEDHASPALSLSVGSAMRASGEPLAAALRLADERMYADKLARRAGRAR